MTAPAGADPTPTTTTYAVTQCQTEFNVDFWETGKMLHGQGTIVFDVYRYVQGEGWVYFGKNTDTIWGLLNGVNGAGGMHGGLVFNSTIGDFTGTWSAGSESQGISGVGQIVARSTDGSLKLQTPKNGLLDPAQYPPLCDAEVGTWVVTSH
ncbi:hypothetical protein [Humibacillus xanthopallidus]|nr:hypothetical protein [Humibacillus xanthopallidus]